MDIRPGMVNFKLATVALHRGLKPDETKLHDAEYDIQLTREVWDVLRPTITEIKK
jgi:DNA polymerase III subunit epsilon